MNRNYKVIWNRSLGCFTAVAEYAKSRGKTSNGVMSSSSAASSAITEGARLLRLSSLSVALAATGLALSTQAFAVSGIAGGTGNGTAISACTTTGTPAGIPANQANSGTSDKNIALGCDSSTTNGQATLLDRGNPYYTNIANGSGITPLNPFTPNNASAGSVAIGTGSTTGQILSVALGEYSKTESIAGVAIGPAALSKGNTALAIGRQSVAAGDFSQALGNVSAATGTGSLAVGHSATATGYRSIAIGAPDIAGAGSVGGQPGAAYQTTGQTKATAIDTIALGGGAQATADNALSIGAFSSATANRAVAMGNSASATNSESTALGSAAQAFASSATAVGFGARADQFGATAIGASSRANALNSVALGSSSVANAQSGTSFLTNVAANANNGTVSIGNDGVTRRITNVAGGSADTDGVNVAQLRAQNTLTNKLGGDTAAALGGTSTYNPVTGAVTAPTYNVNGVANNNVGAAITSLDRGFNLNSNGNNGSAIKAGDTVDIGTLTGENNLSVVKTGNTIDFSLNKNLDLGAAGSVKTGNSLLNNAGLTITGGPSITATGINAAGNQIIGVATAGNITELANANKAVNAGDLNTAVTGLTNTGFNISAQGANSDNVKLGQTVDFRNSDGNLVATKSADNTITYNLANSIKANQVTVGSTATGGNNTVLTSTANGLSVGGDKITNVGAGTIGDGSTDAVNGGQVNTLVNTVTGQLNTTNQQVTSNTTAISNINNGAGIKYFRANSALPDSQATGTNSIAIGPNTTASNTRSVALGVGAQSNGVDSLALGSASQAKSLNSIALGADAIANGSVDNNSGTAIAIGRGSRALGNAGNQIALGDGAIAGDLSLNQSNIAIGTSASSTGLESTVIGNSARSSANEALALGNGANASIANSVALGARTVTRSATNVTGTTIGGTAYTFAGTTPSTAGVVSVGSVGAERQIQNVAAGQLTTTSTDAVNGSQLNATNDAVTNNTRSTIGNTDALGGGANYNANSNTYTAPTYTVFTDPSNTAIGGTGTGSNVRTVGDAITALNSAVQTPLTFVGDSGDLVERKLGETLLVKGGVTTAADLTENNIGVVSSTTDNHLSIKLAEKIDLGDDGSVTTGNTVVNDAGITIDDGADNVTTITTTGTFFADDQGNNANYGSTGSTLFDDAGNTTITSVTGTSVENAFGNTSTYSANGLTATNRVGSTIVDQTGLSFTNPAGTAIGPSITATGINANNTKITNLTNGNIAANSKEAINGGQLNTAASSIATNLGGGSSFDPTTGTVRAPSYTLNGVAGAANNVGTALTNIDGRVITNTAAINSGIKFNVDGLQKTFALGEEIKVDTDDNINVTANTTGDGVNVALNPNLDLGDDGSVTTGNSTLNSNGLTITQPTGSAAGITTVSLTNNGLDNGGNKITNVGAGTIATGSTDAVNGGQLSALTDVVAAQKIKYFSVNSTGGTNEDNQGATGNNAIAIGKNTSAAGNTSVAIGNRAQSVLAGATAVGNGAVAAGISTVAVGENSRADIIGDVAIGVNSIATGGGADNIGAVALGADSKALGNGNIAIGDNATSENGNRATALGSNATTTGSRTTALGYNSVASGTAATALGDAARAEGRFAIAIRGQASADNAIALGGQASADSAIAIGGRASADNAIALGGVASAANSVSIGQGSVANGRTLGTAAFQPLNVNGNPIAVVAPTAASEVSVGAAGSERRITNVAAGGNDTDAVNVSQLKAVDQKVDQGIKFNVNGGERTYALGETIGVTTDANLVTTATDDGVNVALANAINIGTDNPIAINGTTGRISGLTNTSFNPNSFTSGQAATEDQLKVVSDVANRGFDITVGQNGGTTTGGGTDNIGTGDRVAIDSGKNIAFTVDNTEGVPTLTVSTEDEVEFTQVTIGDDTNNTVLTSTANGLDVGGDRITNVGAGSVASGSTDAINGGQLNTAASSIATNLGGGSTFDPATGTVTAPSYTLNGVTGAANTVGAALTNIDSRVITNTAAIDSGIKFNVDGLQRTFALGEEIKVDTDDNINVTANTTGDGVNVALNPDLDLGDDGSVTTGNTVVNNNGFELKNGDNNNQSVTITSAGINNGGNQIVNVANATIDAASLDAVNGGQIFNIATSVADNFGGNSVVNADGTVSAPNYLLDNGFNTGTDAPAFTNVGDALDNLDTRATSNTAEINKGISFNVDGLQRTFALGEEIKVNTDDNINVTANTTGDGVNVALNPNLDLGDDGSVTTGNSTLNSSGLTITQPTGSAAGITTVSLTNNGLDNGGNKITNVGAGTIATGSTDAVNGGQLSDLTDTVNSIDFPIRSSNTQPFTTSAIGTDALAVGSDAQANGDNSTAVGENAIAAASSVALGEGARATGTNSVIIGRRAGDGSDPSNVRNVAVGDSAGTSVRGNNNAAFGSNAGSGVTANGNTAIGDSSGQAVSGAFNTALGINSGQNVTGENNIAIGNNAGRGTTASNTIAIGTTANASATRAVAIGTGTSATGSESTALGSAAQAFASSATAVGFGARADQFGATAIGASSRANALNSVALGSSSVANAQSGTSFLTNVAANANNGTVSIGNDGVTRRITNVAGGSADTDGVNVAQLRAQNTLTNKLGGDTASGLGGNSSYDADTGTLTTALTVGGENYTNVNDALNVVNTTANRGFDVTTAATGTGTATGTSVANVAPGSTQTITAGDNIAITQDGINLTIATNPDLVATSLTTGNTVTDNAGVRVDDDNGNSTTITTAGTTVTDDDGNTGVYGAANTVLTDDDGNINASSAIGNAILNNDGGNISGNISAAAGNIIFNDEGANISGAAGNFIFDNAGNTTTTSATGLTAADNAGNSTIVDQSGLRFTDTNGATGPSINRSGIDAGSTKITNVLAGTVTADSTEAVNGGQLSDLTDVVNNIDFPIRSSNTQPFTTSATGIDALAVGSDAQANGDNSTAVGENAQATAIQASAFGAGAEATGRSSLASGFEAKAKSGESVALGVRSSAEGLGATAVGPTANARGDNSVALGRRSRADGVGAVSLGGFSKAQGENATAVGFESEATAANTSAFGTNAKATLAGATAIGNEALARGVDATAIGNSSVAGRNSVALGRDADATASGTVAVGTQSFAGQGATVVGTNARATGQDSTALGRFSEASAIGGVALGKDAKANALNSVALGSSSVANAQSGTSFLTNVAANADNGTVSIGNDGVTRRITNVAGGSADTDGVNVAQLRAQNTLTNKLGGDTAAALGGESEYNPVDGSISAPTYTLNNGNNDTGTTDFRNVGAALGNLDGRTTSNTTEINKGIVFNVNGGERTYALGETIGVTTDANLVTTATDDGVNVALANAINIGTENPISINGTNGTISGLTNTTFDPTATYEGGQAATQEQLSAASNALTDQGFNITADNVDLLGGVTEDNVKLGQTVDFTNNDGNLEAIVRDNQIVYNLSDNINVSSVTATDGAGDNVVLNQSGLSFISGAGAMIGPSITKTGINAGNTVITGVTAGSVAAGSTEAINGGQLFGTAQSVANNFGGESVVNEDGTVSAPTYTLNNGNNDTGTTDFRNVGAALGNLDGRTTSNTTEINKGIVFNVNGGERTYALGETIGVTTDANLVTTATDDGVNVALANAINIGTENPISINGTNGTISGLTNTTFDPTATYEGGQAATQEQLSAASGALTDTGFNISAQGANSDNVKLGQTVDFRNSDGNLVATRTVDNTINYDLADDITVNQVTIGDDTNNTALTSTANGLDVGGDKITNVGAGNITATSTDAINGGQLFNTTTSIKNAIGGSTVVNSDGTITTANIGGTGQNTIDGAISSLKTAATQAKSTVTNGDNIVVNTTTNTDGSTNYEVATADNISLDSVTTGNTVTNNNGVAVSDGEGNSSTMTTAGTTVNNAAGNTANYGANGIVAGNATDGKSTIVNQDGLSFTDTDGNTTGLSITAGGINVGNTVIGGVANGVLDSDAANIGQLNSIAAVANQGFNVTTSQTGTGIATGTSVANVAPGSTQTITAGNNVSITQNGTDLTIATNPDLVVDSVTATDDDGNETSLTATGTSIANAAGNTNNSTATGNTITNGANVTTVTGAGTNVTDGTNTTNYGATGFSASNGTNTTIVNKNGVSFTNSTGAATGPSITAGGINAGGQIVTGVADGIEVTDAANVGQLNTLGNQIGGAINDLGYRVDEVEDEANAGISAAMAMSSIPQSFLPGKSLVGGGIATYNGESAVAVGLSRVSDNGRWVMKVSGTADTQGNAGGAIGAGFHF